MGALIRDITKVGFMSKSEVRDRINEIIKGEFDSGYRKGVKDEVDCIMSFGEHGEAVRKIRKQERKNMIRVIKGKKRKGIII